MNATDFGSFTECWILLLAFKEIAILASLLQQWILLALADLITEAKKALPDVRFTGMKVAREGGEQ